MDLIGGNLILDGVTGCIQSSFRMQMSIKGARGARGARGVRDTSDTIDLRQVQRVQGGNEVGKRGVRQV